MTLEHWLFMSDANFLKIEEVADFAPLLVLSPTSNTFF